MSVEMTSTPVLGVAVHEPAGDSVVVAMQSNPMAKGNSKADSSVHSRPSAAVPHRRNSTRLPDGWQKYADDATGHRYYAHRNSGESSWVPPEGSTGGSARNSISSERGSTLAGTTADTMQVKTLMNPMKSRQNTGTKAHEKTETKSSEHGVAASPTDNAVAAEARS